MSYILDALRRSQVERSRGRVPDLHTPASSHVGHLPVLQAGQPVAWGVWWVIGALILLAAALLLVWRWPASTEDTTNTVTSTAAVDPAEPALAQPAPPTPPVVQEKPPAPEKAVVHPSAPVTSPTVEEPPTTPSTPMEPTPSPIFALADLPPAVRNQLPALQLAGLTYSANPAHRMVIVNGQVLHEGETAAPELVLERIETQRTVWRFQQWRYAVPMP